MPNQATMTVKIFNVPTSMAQHRWLNIDCTLKCPKPTKTPKTPNRQKPPKIPGKNPRQKFQPAKKKSQQKFPINKNSQLKK
jgi:hypothetical protein